MIQPDLFDNRPQVKKLNVLPPNPESMAADQIVGNGRFPSWLHRKLPAGAHINATSEILGQQHLHTVCEEAKCPNRLECWSRKTATFLVMGKECTRSCGFCSIDFSKTPQPLDSEEPKKVAESAKVLGLRHVVVTMVARDDLADGGAAHLVAIVNELRSQLSKVVIELLISDLAGNYSALDQILASKPHIFNHNVETVRELTPRVRHRATYNRSLEILRYAKIKSPDLILKSGLMVGLGEEKTQVQQTIIDLCNVGCDMITIGQYLQSEQHKLRVKAFIHPAQFEEYAEFGRSVGVKYMSCGPFVRSSYHAADHAEELLNGRLFPVK